MKPTDRNLLENERPSIRLAAVNTVHVSVLIPVFNEQQTLAELHRRLSEVLRSLNVSYEILFVDDGSRDNSQRIIRGLAATDPAVRALFLSRNFGHQPAIAAAIDHARGAAVVVMDADLQDPPELIPQLLEKWKAGYQVVFAIRKKRKEPWPKRLAFRVFYRLLRVVANLDIPLDAGDFSLMDRTVVNLLKQMPERNRFIRGLRSWIGFNQIGIEYERQERFAGKPRLTFKKLFKLAVDGFLSFSYVPLRAALWVGLASFLFSFGYIGYALYSKYILRIAPPGWTSLAVAVMMLGGTQLVLTGFIGEYIGRIYDEVRQRPYYIIAEALNVEEPVTAIKELPHVGVVVAAGNPSQRTTVSR